MMDYFYFLDVSFLRAVIVTQLILFKGLELR